MLTRRFLISTTALIATVPAMARAQTPAASVGASSPDGILSIQVSVNGEGRPEYSVTRLGRPVIAASRLGFILTDGPKLERNFIVSAEAPTQHDDTWEQPWGEQRFIRNRYTQLRVHLTERNGLQRRLDVVSQSVIKMPAKPHSQRAMAVQRAALFAAWTPFTRL